MTVSRVINTPDKVSKETREKVLKAIEECHYYPNSFARGLASNKKYIIGIVIYDSYRTRHNMFYEMINGIERVASKFQYNIMLFSYVEGEDYANRIVESGMVDGVIFMGVTMNYKDIKYLDKIGFPYVVIGKRNIEDVDPYTLVLDYREAFQRATQYLIDSGYKEIGFVGVARDFDPISISFWDTRVLFMKAVFYVIRKISYILTDCIRMVWKRSRNCMTVESM
ncbi:LacI family transcriptional regulator [Blautia sp. RD014234]|nr:LacI family transcriptional regulator [Blautia parvula]